MYSLIYIKPILGCTCRCQRWQEPETRAKKYSSSDSMNNSKSCEKLEPSGETFFVLWSLINCQSDRKREREVVRLCKCLSFSELSFVVTTFWLSVIKTEHQKKYIYSSTHTPESWMRVRTREEQDYLTNFSEIRARQKKTEFFRAITWQ